MRTLLAFLICSLTGATAAFAQADIATTGSGVTFTASFFRNGEVTPFFTDTGTILPEEEGSGAVTATGIDDYLMIGVRIADPADTDFTGYYDGQVLLFFYYDHPDWEETYILHPGDFDIVVSGLFPEGGGQFGGFDIIKGVVMTDGVDPYPLMADFISAAFDAGAGTLHFSMVGGSNVTIDNNASVGIVGNFTAVPEPATIALVFGLAAGVIAWRRRRV